MNSSEPSATNTPAPSGPALLKSNWIEFLAVPISSAIMETQPTALVLLIAIPQLFGSDSFVPDTLSILLMMLGLHWWAIATRYYAQQRGGQPSIPVSIAGLLIALALYFTIHVNALDSAIGVLAPGALGIWFWKRGVDRARDGLNDDKLITAFKIGFTAMLVVMVFAFLATLGNNPIFNDMLLRALPIFFLSGLIALSFTRIGILQREQSRHKNATGRDSTTSWLGTMTVVWILLVVAAIALEALPLAWLMDILQPVWSLLGLLALVLLYLFSWLTSIFLGFFFLVAYAFIWLINLFGGKPSTGQAPPQQPQMPPAIKPEHADNANTLLLRIAIGVGILLAVIIIARFATKKQTKVVETGDDEEELRESLDRDQILRERRAARDQDRVAPPVLPPLDPDSARARYREFLTALSDKDLPREDNETPLEYQQRVLEQTGLAYNQPDTDPQSSPLLLNNLTRSYNQERYGGQALKTERQTYLRQWVPQLVQRLTSRIAPKSNTPTRSHQANRWGEDY